MNDVLKLQAEIDVEVETEAPEWSTLSGVCHTITLFP